MAYKNCPSCGGSGTGYDIDRNQTCLGCGGKGEIWVPDPVVVKPPNPQKSKPKNTGSWFGNTGNAPKKSTKKTNTLQKKSNFNAKQAKPKLSKKKSIEEKPLKEAPTGVKVAAVIIAIIVGAIAISETNNVPLSFLIGIVAYLLSGAAMVLMIALLNITVKVLKVAFTLGAVMAIVFVISQIAGI